MSFFSQRTKTTEKIENVQKRITQAMERVRIRPEAFARRLVGEQHFRLRTVIT